VTEVSAGIFTPKATEFFTGLERDNSKDYWTANKAVFENEVKEPMAALVESLPERFGPFKIFRMNRDIRFSPDKSPYKTQHGRPTKPMARSITYTWTHRGSWRRVART
jgi:uncharacterized protein (DUF2461 family)